MKAPVRSSDAFAPVKISSAQVADIVTELRNDIVMGVIAPGAPLGQEALAERFGVSRMPIREAIRHLETMGFVNVESNKRTRVAETSLNDFRDIYDMRLALECVAMRSAMAHLTNAQIDEAERIQQDIAGADPLSFGQLNHAFHMTLYRPCNRPRLLSQVDILFNAADRYLCILKAPPGMRAKSDAEHIELIEACRKRGSEAAEACLRRHIGDAAALFEEQFAE